jgi:hypothetical protein
MAKPISTMKIAEKVELLDEKLQSLLAVYEVNTSTIMNAINKNESIISKLKMFSFFSAAANLILLYLILN